MKQSRVPDCLDLPMSPAGEVSLERVAVNARVRLVLPVGMASLRRIDTKGVAARDLAAAMVLRAEETLPDPIADYYTDEWAIAAESRGLVAIARAPLVRARAALESKGITVCGLLVPELCPPLSVRTSAVFWRLESAVLGCCWRAGHLVDWHWLPVHLPAPAAMEQFAVCLASVPERVYLTATDGYFRDLVSAVALCWPAAEIKTLSGAVEDLDRQGFGGGPGFATFVQELEHQTAGIKDKVRVGAAAVAAALAGWLFWYSDIRSMEQQVDELQRQTSLLKVQAARSEKVAALSGEALRDIRELRQMTVERANVLTVLKTLSDSLPPRVKLQNILLERGGLAAFEGLAESELDVTRLLERLSATTTLQSPVLVFAQRETERKAAAAEPAPTDSANVGEAVHFRLEARLVASPLTLPGVDDAARTQEQAPASGADET